LSEELSLHQSRLAQRRWRFMGRQSRKFIIIMVDITGTAITIDIMLIEFIATVAGITIKKPRSITGPRQPR
jgi:hypothetical protein